MGFLFGYLWTRLVFTGALRAADQAAIGELVEEVNEQKQKLDDVTVLLFLFENLVNEAELRHLEGLASPDPYPLEKTGFAEEQLRHLRASRLITVPSGIGRLPKQIRDLHEHAALTKVARDYLEHRKTLKSAMSLDPVRQRGVPGG